MTSERQKIANRANSQHSTGPKTPNGKQVAGLNGLQHGLRSARVVLADEDLAEFEGLRKAVHGDLTPIGAIETFLVDRIVNAIWRIYRSERIESAMLQIRGYEFKARNFTKRMRAAEKVTYVIEMWSPTETRTTITDELAHAEASADLHQAEAEQNRDEVLIGHAFNNAAIDGDVFNKLLRYETTLQRSIGKAMNDLRVCQSNRQRQSVPPQ